MSRNETLNVKIPSVTEMSKNDIDTVENSDKKGFFGKILAGASLVVVGATNAMAEATLTAPTFALDDVAVVAVALSTGLAGFWAIRKGLSLIR